jgi:hypothetical protein
MRIQIEKGLLRPQPPPSLVVSALLTILGYAIGAVLAVATVVGCWYLAYLIP